MTATRAPLAAFFAMTKKALDAIGRFIEEFGGDRVAFVMSHPDDGVVPDTFEDIQALCARHSVPFLRRGDPFSLDGVVAFAIGWRWLIDVDGEDPARQLLVFHDSVLPRYRGFAPLVAMLINGENHLGVTCIRAADDYDRGPVVDQMTVEVTYPMRIGEAIDLVAPLYGEILVRLWSKLAAGEVLVGTPQQDELATYSLWRDAGDYRIRWHWDAARVRRFIDATGRPFRGASCVVDGRLVRITEAREVEDVTVEHRDVGKVIFVRDGLPVVVCGSGLLRIDDAIDDVTGESILPLARFRTRFG